MVFFPIIGDISKRIRSDSGRVNKTFLLKLYIHAQGYKAHTDRKYIYKQNQLNLKIYYFIHAFDIFNQIDTIIRVHWDFGHQF